jgi:hypothetical protein
MEEEEAAFSPDAEGPRKNSSREALVCVVEIPNEFV